MDRALPRWRPNRWPSWYAGPLGLRGEPVAAVSLVLMVATVVAEIALLSRFLTSLGPDVSVADGSGSIASGTGGQDTAGHRPTADTAP